MFIGVSTTAKEFIKNRFSLWSNKIEMHNLIYLALLITPIVMIIVLSSTLYNGWSQLYFIYRAFVLIALKGFMYLFNNLKQKLRNLLCIALICSFTWNAYWIV